MLLTGAVPPPKPDVWQAAFFSPHIDSKINKWKTVFGQCKNGLEPEVLKRATMPKSAFTSIFKMVSSSTENSTLSAGAAAENSHGPERAGALSVKVVIAHVETRYQKHLKELGGFRSVPTHEDEMSWKRVLDHTV